MTNFLIHQEVLHIGSLIARQLNYFSDFFVLLYGAVARKVLLEGLANSFDVQIVGQTCHGCDTFASVSLLYTNMNLFFRSISGLVTGILKGV